jgi:hypothetical protein
LGMWQRILAYRAFRLGQLRHSYDHGSSRLRLLPWFRSMRSGFLERHCDPLLVILAGIGASSFSNALSCWLIWAGFCVRCHEFEVHRVQRERALDAVDVARIIFEALQRYRILRPDGKTLPTVLVMEEAHTFIRRYRDDSEEQSSAATCCRVFERIAREGRKFGLGLVLSSQRPSELSQTVLSQCNSFLLHRISNDKDQEAVSKLLPDHLRGILRELPVLPTRHAFLLGWASELPILTHIRELPKRGGPLFLDHG